VRFAARTRRRIGALKRKISDYRYRLPSISLESVVPQSIEVGELILDDICLPPYFGPADHDDVHPLLCILRFVQPRIVVELGTGYGNSAANICRQCPDATVYTVSALPEQLTGVVITYELSRDEIGRVYRAHGFDNRVIQIHSNTVTVDWSRYFSNPVVNLALIDACHDFDYVVNDFERIRPYMHQEGLVLFHDTHPSMKGHLGGSYLACVELRRRGHDVRYLEGTWWAVWRNRVDRRPPQGATTS
jgi:hypothetical protein